ncbi:right-handed parallel beta-helix repeat-containing protein [Pedococcus bigeumensis]|uniref:Uncharacterized protein n=1 Tax=Pedococcus bigeumensis TaxID=433644 RepID=A0A502D4D2_9MICO|nr:right-handed parallel beta-helix repeat-containing protein [Pedococcus bigeumensis]TPG18966.1 hypothetical protein EAH86_00025 [Pedococcus bigeumensis]
MAPSPRIISLSSGARALVVLTALLGGGAVVAAAAVPVVQDTVQPPARVAAASTSAAPGTTAADRSVLPLSSGGDEVSGAASTSMTDSSVARQQLRSATSAAPALKAAAAGASVTADAPRGTWKRKPPPTTTTTTTPPPAGACATAKVWATLAACGWPGPGNTGYPAGQTFVAKSAVVVQTDNTVIDGWKVTGGIVVSAKNVTIRNSWVTNDGGGASGSAVIFIEAGASATIEHTTMDGLNHTHACIFHVGTSFRAVANDCKGINDGIFMWSDTPGADGTGDNFTIQDNWLHAFTTNAANGHIDGIQTEGAKNGVIRHNTIDVAAGQDSAIALWNSRKSVDNVVIDHNLMQGGGFATYAEDYSPSESSPAGGYSVTRVSYTNNVFSTSRYGCVGQWGVWYTRGKPTDGWNRTGNYVLETGQKIDSANPSVSGQLCT